MESKFDIYNNKHKSLFSSILWTDLKANMMYCLSYGCNQVPTTANNEV